MHTSEYVVTGMSCGGCEASVREAVSRIPGVTGVEVSARNGRLTVSADEQVEDTTVIAAVDAAGYTAVRG